MKFNLYERERKQWPQGIGVECLHCGLSLKVGQSVVAGRGSISGTSCTVGFHLDCLRELSAEYESTDTAYSRIVGRVSATNGDPFGFKERHGY